VLFYRIKNMRLIDVVELDKGLIFEVAELANYVYAGRMPRVQVNLYRIAAELPYVFPMQGPRAYSMKVAVDKGDILYAVHVRGTKVRVYTRCPDVEEVARVVQEVFRLPEKPLLRGVNVVITGHVRHRDDVSTVEFDRECLIKMRGLKWQRSPSVKIEVRNCRVVGKPIVLNVFGRVAVNVIIPYPPTQPTAIARLIRCGLLHILPCVSAETALNTA